MKVFVEEPGRDEVVDLLDEATVATTSRLSYVECRTAFARAVRERRSSKAEEGRIARQFELSWSHLHIVEFDEALARQAADLTRTHELRAGDAIHLASALLIGQTDRKEVAFACWDARLWRVAKAFGFLMSPRSVPKG